MKRTDLNADAYKLLNSYHYKTHFKAAKEVAVNNIKSKEKNINNNKKNKTGNIWEAFVHVLKIN